MTAPRPWVVFAAAFLVAGCLADKAPGTAPVASEDPNDVNETGEPNARPAERRALPESDSFERALLVNCRGWIATHPWSRPMGDLAVPPGWEPRIAESASSRLSIPMYWCEHISIGPLERGNFWLAVEVHNQRNVPPACREVDGGSEAVVVAVTWVVSDDEIAKLLGMRIGAPVHVGSFQKAGGPGFGEELSIDVVGGGRTAFTFRSGDESPPFGTLDERHAIDRAAGGLTLVDFAWNNYSPRQSGQPLANGTAAMPFVMASGQQAAPVRTATVYERTDIELRFWDSEDYACASER